MNGTIVNVIAIVAGALLGTKLGGIMPEKFKQTIINALGLSTLILGIHMGVKSQNLLIVMGSLLIGGILGEWFRLDDRLNWMGMKLESRFAPSNNSDSTKSISKAFVTSTLIYCIGPLAIIGSILDGLTGNSMPLYIKSILDGFASLAFGASMGIGVVFSAIPVLIYQGSISLSAKLFGDTLGTVTEQTPAIIELSATGGVIIIGLSIILLDLKKIRLANFLPAIFLAPIMVKLSEFFQ